LCFFFFGFVILLKPFFNGNFQFSLAKSITCSIQNLNFGEFWGYFFNITNSPCVFLVCLWFLGFFHFIKVLFNGNFQFSLRLQFSLAKSITCSIQKLNFWDFWGYFFHITNSPCVFLVCLCFFFWFCHFIKALFNGNYQFSLGLQFSFAKSITCSIQK
jgi:hypothetical protein